MNTTLGTRRILPSSTQIARRQNLASNHSIPVSRKIHLSSVVVWAADGITSISAAGIPWYLSIPLVATGINVTFRLPIQYYTRRLVLRRAELNPLITAWSRRHMLTFEPGHNEAEQRRVMLRVTGLTERSRRRIYKTWGVQRWKMMAPFLSMVPFIIVSEALRQLSGAPTGWLSHSLGMSNIGAQSTTDLCSSTMAQGGCLWFPDLTAMDPYFALPLFCSALLIKTSWGRLSKEQLRSLLPMSGSNSSQSPMQRIQTTLGRVLLMVPILPLVFADLPSAIFVYWASTFALNDINEGVVKKLLPKKEVPLHIGTQRPIVVSPLLKNSKPDSSQKMQENRDKI